MVSSDLERTLETLWRQLGGPPLDAEHRFAPPRRWRFDFVHHASRIAIECEGGVYTGGRHTRGAGFEKDAEKYNTATALGWRVFRVTRKMLEDDPVGTLDPIIELTAVGA